MRKLLIASAFLALALPVAASAETLTTGVANSVGTSCFTGMSTSHSNGEYQANGTLYTMTYANKSVGSGFDDAFSGEAKSNDVHSVNSPGKTTEVYDNKSASRDNGWFGKGRSSESENKGSSVTEKPGTTTTTDKHDSSMNITQTHLGDIKENSGSVSVMNASFAEHQHTDNTTSGHLTQFSANSSVSSFASSGI